MNPAWPVRHVTFSRESEDALAVFMDACTEAQNDHAAALDAADRAYADTIAVIGQRRNSRMIDAARIYQRAVSDAEGRFITAAAANSGAQQADTGEPPGQAGLALQPGLPELPAQYPGPVVVPPGNTARDVEAAGEERNHSGPFIP